MKFYILKYDLHSTDSIGGVRRILGTLLADLS